MRLGSRVFHTFLVHREDELPIQLEERFVNPRGVARQPEHRLRPSPNQVLVDQPTASALGIASAAPCLSVIRRTWPGENLISYARLIHPGDRYKLRSSMRGLRG